MSGANGSTGGGAEGPRDTPESGPRIALSPVSFGFVQSLSKKKLERWVNVHVHVGGGITRHYIVVPPIERV